MTDFSEHHVIIVRLLKEAAQFERDKQYADALACLREARERLELAMAIVFREIK